MFTSNGAEVQMDARMDPGGYRAGYTLPVKSLGAPSHSVLFLYFFTTFYIVQKSEITLIIFHFRFLLEIIDLMRALQRMANSKRVRAIIKTNGGYFEESKK